MMEDVIQDDTFPEWLYNRMRCHFELGPSRVPWRELSTDDVDYWKHEAAAIRRAVARDGFKNYDPSKGQVMLSPDSTSS